MTSLAPADAARLNLLRRLSAEGYTFVTPTPLTRKRVLDRRGDALAETARDILGWSFPFDRAAFPDLAERLDAADALRGIDGGQVQATLRVASLGERLFLHSAPGADGEPVFFGPDSYRFARLIEAELADGTPRRIVDVGTGSGVGGLVAAGLCPHAEVVLSDVNADALRLARINALAAGVDANFVEGGGVDAVEGGFDLALMNPPYMQGSGGHRYRDGGDSHGAELAIRLAGEIVSRLERGGCLILYTGSAIVEGRDQLREALEAVPDSTLRYSEIDPDVFGEMLGSGAYAGVERIAAVAAILTKNG